MARLDSCIIVGAGHNGLVAAFYLARAGIDVTVLERAEQVGGGAVTDELFPGYRIGACAYICHMLQRRVIDDMELRRHGLHIYPLDPAALIVYPDGDSLRYWHDHERTDDEIARISPRDRGAWPKWMEFWEDAARLFQSDTSCRSRRRSRILRGTWPAQSTRPIWDRLLNVPVRVMAEEYFEDPRIAAVAIGSGDYGAISEPGSALAQAYFKMSLLTADEDLGIVRGGMGGVTQAMAKAAQEAGAEIRTGANVSQIIVSDGRAAGVRLESGEEIEAAIVVSNADPKSTFTRLIDERSLPNGFPGFPGLHKSGSGTFNPLGIPEAARHLQPIARLFQVPATRRRRNLDRHGPHHTVARLHRIELARRDERDSDALPDDATADTDRVRSDPRPSGQARHVDWVTYEPAYPRTGSWADIRRDVGNAILDQIESYLPDIRDCIEQWDLFTPSDIGERVGMTDGNIRHLDLVPGQMFANRSLPGCAPYRTPVPGLYMCGAGTHPGGEVSGAPGHNAAHAVIRDRG